MFDFFLLFGVHHLLKRQLLRANCFKLTVVTGVGFNGLELDMCDMRAEAIQEIPVM